MYKFRYNILALVLLLLIASCKTSKHTSVNSKLENALLWKVEGDNVQTSYVYGTIHIIDADDYFLPKGTLTAFDQCPKVVYEIDMEQMNDMSTMMGMMNKLFMSDNKTLADFVTKEEYTLVENHFKKMGIPMAFFERMKPMFLTIFAYDINPSDLQSGNMKSYETEFHKLAKNAKKKTSGLESLDYQIGIFDKIPYKDQAKMLVDAIKSGNDDTSMQEMTDMYKAQDISRMVTDLQADSEGLAKYEDILIVQRNIAWIPIMIKEMTRQSTFFAVGAGHLAGKDGVLKLLRKEGYTVTPISHVK